jgi:hypothetical protein
MTRNVLALEIYGIIGRVDMFHAIDSTFSIIIR